MLRSIDKIMLIVASMRFCITSSFQKVFRRRKVTLVTLAKKTMAGVLPPVLPKAMDRCETGHDIAS